MDRKIPAIVVLAALTTEVVADELHHAIHSQPHVETGVNAPANSPTATMSGGPGRAVSATGTLTPNEDRLAAQPHIEPNSGTGPAATGIDLNQIA
jgi:hypothetical protein